MFSSEARTLLYFALAAVLAARAQSGPSLNLLDGSRISAQKANEIAADELKKDNIMGAQLAILNKGKLVWAFAYGLRDAGKHLPMTPDTNIWAASITKGVFATWVMHLVEQHRLDLDRPLAGMLPKPLDSYEPYKESATELVKDSRWARVTPRMVLSHTAGFSNLASLTEPDKKLRLHFEPGSRFAYSGDGLNLLQFVLEETVIHEPLEVAMQRDLFTPLGMSRTGMVWHDDFAADMALRYGAAGQYLATTHKANARAAGNMATSVDDLSAFLVALLNGKLLSSSTRRDMLSPQIRINTAHQFPTLSLEEGSEAQRAGLAYGLGWGLLTSTKYGPAFFKEGHGDGAQNYLICFTKSQTCMILLTNSDNGELAFRPLLEKLIGDTVTPWEWESYTREAIMRGPEHATGK